MVGTVLQLRKLYGCTSPGRRHAPNWAGIQRDLDGKCQFCPTGPCQAVRQQPFHLLLTHPQPSQLFFQLPPSRGLQQEEGTSNGESLGRNRVCCDPFHRYLRFYSLSQRSEWLSDDASLNGELPVWEQGILSMFCCLWYNTQATLQPAVSYMVLPEKQQ